MEGKDAFEYAIHLYTEEETPTIRKLHLDELMLAIIQFIPKRPLHVQILKRALWICMPLKRDTTVIFRDLTRMIIVIKVLA